MNVKRLNDLPKCNPDASMQVMLPNGAFLPEHFHITEVGRVHKQFIDCGGTRRNSIFCVLQIWVANDVHHRLDTTKLRKIMNAGTSLVGGEMSVVIEHGSDTVPQYLLGDVEVTPKGLLFVLGTKPTECLAPDKCGVEGCC